MPKEVIPITQFNAGIIGTVDNRDIPLDAFAYSENVNPRTGQGSVLGIEGDTSFVTGGAGRAHTIYKDGTRAIFFATSGEIKEITDLDHPTTPVVTTIEDEVRSGEFSGEYSTEFASGVLTGSENLSGATDGIAVRIGTGSTSSDVPRWVGQLTWDKFDYDLPFGTQSLSAVIKNASDVFEKLTWNSKSASIEATTEEEALYAKGQRVFLFASLVYDGYQEGPIVQWGDSYEVTEPYGIRYLPFYIRIDPGAMDLRVTGINLYQATGTVSSRIDDGSNAADTEPQLIMALDITTNEKKNRGRRESGIFSQVFGGLITSGQTTDAWVGGLKDTGASFLSDGIQPGFLVKNTTLSSQTQVKSVQDNNVVLTTGDIFGSSGYDYEIYDARLGAHLSITSKNAFGQTYTDRTGVNSLIDHMTIHYALNTTTKSYHFVANCWNPDIPEANRIIYRSKPYRFDVFDWVNDFLLLPEPPVGLHTYQGKLFAFTKYRVFVINPDTLDYETLEGFGTFDQTSAIATDRGLLFCNNSNIYLYDGELIHPIGNPILQNEIDSDAAWLSRNTTVDPEVAYDSRFDSFLIAYKNASGTISILMYTPQRELTIDLPRGRWDHVSTSYTTLQGRLQAVDDKPMLGLDGNLRKMFDDGTQKSWEIYLRDFETSPYSKYYDIDIHGSATLTVNYWEDDGSIQSPSLAKRDAGVDDVWRAPLNTGTPPNYTKVKRMRVKISGNATAELESLFITRRKMEQT